MKRLNRKEEAVSPVIATILMVAITVVLAATLYMMVGGFGENGAGTPVSGSLSYRSGDSNATFAVFRITSLQTPSEPSLDTVTIRVFNAEGDQIFSGSGDDLIPEENDWGVSLNNNNEQLRIRHRVSDAGEYIAGGDEIQLRDPDWDGDFSGYEVIVTFSGYSGEISATA